MADTDRPAATPFLRVRNFEKFQHYKDRNPPWIKMYRGLLDDYAFARLQDASKAHAICIMLLASQLDNRVPADPDWIAQRIGANSPVDLDELLSSTFVELCDDASDALASRKQNAPLEEKRREEERQRREEENGTGPVPPSLSVPVFLEAWKDWHDYRRENRFNAWKPSTIRAKLAALEKLGPQKAAEVIRYSIENGYRGIFENKSNDSRPPQRRTGFVGLTDEQRAAIDGRTGGDS